MQATCFSILLNFFKQNLYCGDLKSDHLKCGNILNPDFLKVRFQTVWFPNDQAFATFLHELYI